MLLLYTQVKFVALHRQWVVSVDRMDRLPSFCSEHLTPKSPQRNNRVDCWTSLQCVAEETCTLSTEAWRPFSDAAPQWPGTHVGCHLARVSERWTSWRVSSRSAFLLVHLQKKCGNPTLTPLLTHCCYSSQRCTHQGVHTSKSQHSAWRETLGKEAVLLCAGLDSSAPQPAEGSN